jgi:hypothetical protein
MRKEGGEHRHVTRGDVLCVSVHSVCLGTSQLSRTGWWSVASRRVPCVAGWLVFCPLSWRLTGVCLFFVLFLKIKL